MTTLPPGPAKVLTHIKTVGHVQPHKEIASAVGIPRGSVQDCIVRLVAARFLKRMSSGVVVLCDHQEEKQAAMERQAQGESAAERGVRVGRFVMPVAAGSDLAAVRAVHQPEEIAGPRMPGETHPEHQVRAVMVLLAARTGQ